MKAVPPSSPVAGLVNKRWDLLAASKDQYWRDQKALGIVEALRVASELRDHVEFLIPTWPTEKDREEDLETHRRVAEALARTAAQAPPTVRRVRNSRPRRVR